MKISKRERTLIFIVLILAAVGAYYLLFLKPYMTEINELNIEKANSEIQVETYAQLKTNVDALDVQIEEKEAEIIEYSKNISTGFDQPPVLVYLEDTVGMYAQKKMFVFGMADYMGQMTISPVIITMVTTYDGLTGFIDEVTQNDYIVNVTQIEARIVEQAADPDEQVGEEAVEEAPIDAGDDGEADDAAEPVMQEVTPEVIEYISEGIELVANSDQLLEVSITLEIYTMAGDVPSDTVYIFDNNDYIYGGDIFY
ncbi:MAG: hypothetical protein HN389_03940 [Clostridia bacterium]|jgi:hypothetical protein|nr:hypothetical protein [Clostridia bacterium]